jgi:hypothetical protein
MFMTRDGGNCPKRKKQQNLHRTVHLPGNFDWFISTRVLPSSDDSGNIFSGAPP